MYEAQSTGHQSHDAGGTQHKLDIALTPIQLQSISSSVSYIEQAFSFNAGKLEISEVGLEEREAGIIVAVTTIVGLFVGLVLSLFEYGTSMSNRYGFNFGCWISSSNKY